MTSNPSRTICGQASRGRPRCSASAVKKPMPAGSTWKTSLTTSPSWARRAPVVAVADSATLAPVTSADVPSSMTASGPTRWKKSNDVSPVASEVSVTSPPMKPPSPCATIAAPRPTTMRPALNVTAPELPVEAAVRGSLPDVDPRRHRHARAAGRSRRPSTVMSVSPPPPKGPPPAKTSLPGEMIDSSPEPVRVAEEQTPRATVRVRGGDAAITVKRPLLRLKPLAMISWPTAKPSARKSPAGAGEGVVEQVDGEVVDAGRRRR